MSNEAEVRNLEAISRAIDQHNDRCPLPAVEVRMNPFEVERLGWEDIRGLPIVPDRKISTGRFRIVCAGEKQPGEETKAEATVAAPAEREVEVEREGDLLRVA